METLYTWVVLFLIVGVQSLQEPKEYPDMNMLELVAEMELTALEKYALKARVIDYLKKPGNFTLFAPTNKAFDDLPEDVKKKLGHRGFLRMLFAYHFVPKKIFWRDIQEGSEIETFLPLKMLKFNILHHDIPGKNGVNFVSGAPILRFDQQATNGNLFLIDKVLMPPWPEQMDELPTDYPALNMLELATELKTTELIDLLNATDLLDELTDSDNLTLFAPTDEAFAKLPDPNTIIGNKTLLTEILKYHMSPQTVYWASVRNQKKIPSLLQDTMITFKIHDQPGKPAINKVEDSEIILFDQMAKNGVLYLVDTVMMPPNKTADDTLYFHEIP